MNSRKLCLMSLRKSLFRYCRFILHSTFCSLAYEGSITKQFPVFVKVIIIVMAGHYLWMTLLYCLGGAYSGKNPVNVVKNYGPAYITARRHDVFSRHSGSGIGVREKIGTYSQGRYGRFRHPAVCQYSSVRIGAYRSILRHDGFKGTLRHSAGTFNHDFILRTAGVLR